MSGPAGRYREAGPNRWDRFAYVFKLSDTQRLVRLTVEHPDDATRSTVVASAIPTKETYSATTEQVLGNGLLSGDLFRRSNKMIRRQYVFATLSEHLAIIIETGVAGQRAAVGSLTLEEAELGSYGPFCPPPALQAQEHRHVGLYWEDPVVGQNFGWTGTDYARWDETLKRALDYMAWTGQDLVVYPTVWYLGPMYRSEVEPCFWPSGGRYHPASYPRLMALRCAERGIKFVPSFNTWHWLSLQHLILPKERVIAGDPAVNTVTCNGEVMTSNNWHSLPLLNAQHPTVQAAVLRLVDEQVAMCGDLPSFAGVQFRMGPSSPMQAGPMLLTSYDDWTVGEFARHIGETPPGDPQSAGRFKQRADWILTDPQRRTAWVRWRCDCMTGFYNEVAARLAEAGPHAKLRLALEMPYPWNDTEPAQALLQQGIDLAALSRNRQIVIERLTNQTYHRICRLADPTFAPPGGTEVGVITDYDAIELTERFQRPFRSLPHTAVTIHQQYFETPYRFFVYPGHPTMTFPAPWQAESLTGRCAQPSPTGRHFLRHHVVSLYLFDAKWMAIGGLNIGTFGAEDDTREFATAFRALPAVPFADLGCTGPVVVRWAEAEGYQWIYVVNITDRAARLSLRVQDGRLANAVTGEHVTAPRRHATFTLQPYELRAWRTSLAARVSVCGKRQLPVHTGLGQPASQQSPDSVCLRTPEVLKRALLGEPEASIAVVPELDLSTPLLVIPSGAATLNCALIPGQYELRAWMATGAGYGPTEVWMGDELVTSLGSADGAVRLATLTAAKPVAFSTGRQALRLVARGRRGLAMTGLALTSAPIRHISAWSAVGLFDKPARDAEDTWQVGFDRPLAPEVSQPMDLSASYVGKRGNRITWEQFDVGDEPFNVNELYDYEGMDAVVYLAAWAKSPDRREAMLHYGADWGLKVWLNGQKVVDNSRIGGPNVPLGAQESVTLERGWNQILVKSVSGSIGWWVSVGLTDPEDLTYGTAPPDYD